MQCLVVLGLLFGFKKIVKGESFKVNHKRYKMCELYALEISALSLYNVLLQCIVGMFVQSEICCNHQE